MRQTVSRGRPTRVTALLLMAAAAPSLWAQATVTLELDATEVYVNEAFEATIRVDNFEHCDPPVFPQIAGCAVRLLQGGMDSSQTFIVNGRASVSRSRTYVFELRPQVEGELAIPPIQVSADGRTLQTKPLRLTVRPSDVDQLLAVEIACDRKRIYVGQRVRLTMTIWVRPVRVQGQLLGLRDMMSFIRPINFGPFPTRDIQSAARRLSNPDGTAETYHTYTTWTDYVPDRPGRLNFDDIEVGMQYPTRLARDIFGGWQLRAARNLRAQPKVEDIEVLPLPTQGRPPNFTGAVGTFGIAVAACPTVVRVGDPIQLTVEIRGDGPIAALPPPDLAADPRLTQAFRVPHGELPGEADGSRKRFSLTIRAAQADVTEIPAIEYPYFDPDSELYAVALSEPIPVTVMPAAQLDTSSLVEISASSAGETAPQLRALSGLHGNETRESELLRATAPVRVGHLALATFAPPAVFLLLWGYTTYGQARSPAQRRRRSALRNAQQRIERARHLPPRESAAVVAAALTGYLADRLDQPAARFTGRAAVDFLQARNLPATTRQRWSRVLDRCEQASFGGASNSQAAVLTDQARECLRAIEKERL